VWPKSSKVLTPQDAVNVYVGLGPKALRVYRLSRAEIENGVFSDTIEYTFPAPKVRKDIKKKTSSAKQDESGSEGDEAPAVKKGKAKPKAKAKAKATKPVDEEKDIASASDEDSEEDDMEEVGFDIQTSSDTGEADWEISRPTKAAKSGKAGKGTRGSKVP
jgi:hypothetical protein